MLSSSRLISSANRARSDIDQVIESLSSEQSNSNSSDAKGLSEDTSDVVPEDGLSSSKNCSVERYHDLDGCQQKSAFHLYSCGELSETYTQQLQFDDKSNDADDDTPISSIWETRWFDHAALVGRFMAEDKIHSDQDAAGSDTLQYIPVPSQEITITSLLEPRPESTEVKKSLSKQKSRVKSKVTVTSSSAPPHFKCRVQDCKASFSTQWQRWYHQKSAHRQIQLQCPECHKVFVKLQQLEVHLRSHLKLKIFKCPEVECDKSFCTQQQCNNHALIHSGEKNFECTKCRKTFREKSTLKRHSRTHSQIKLYRCEVCHKSFSYASSLSVHRKHFHARLIAGVETTSETGKSTQTEVLSETEVLTRSVSEKADNEMVSSSVVNNESQRDKQQKSKSKVGGQTVATQTDSSIRTVCTDSDGIDKENEHDNEPESAKSCS
ncbi:RB-associated KRAB zinc finger protein-like [Bolinopsis microptera]|uniref:RB-associated KRAB zinc finger protein-like n=1 Tax=Bolinopsis microptera TaxID=2820187 RepID=UPI00307A99A1